MISNLSFIFLSEDDFVPWKNGNDFDVLLGYDFFHKYRVTVDYNNRLCWIEPYFK